MFELHRLQNTHLALSLRDQLDAAGIACRLDQVGRELRLVVLKDEDAQAARAILQLTLAHPEDKRIRDASWQQGKLLPQRVYAHHELGYWARLWRGMGPLTALVLLICTLVYLMLLWNPTGILAALGAPVSWSVMMAQPWRLLTPCFLHFSLMHLAFNLLWWWQLAQAVELLQSSRRLLMLSLGCALLSNAAQCWWAGPQFGGLSGVIYGLVAYLALYPRWRPELGFRLPMPLFLALMLWLLLGMSGALDSVLGATANAAHVGGLLSGAVLAMIWARIDARPVP